ncbi:DnaJ domain containing protein [Novymonas esmeraldas]|uniref:DnaJ domain containing protein n=1 Tax=Novymonas esmeraldas TaxID=1808958 RepID=A0AAW0EJY7_9TRYP
MAALLYTGGARRCAVRWYAAGGHTSAGAHRSDNNNNNNNSGGGTHGDYHDQAKKEEEEDRALEEEEFAALHDTGDDAFMPLTHRLAHKADALDAELRRIRFCLCERTQFLVDTAPATFSGRATQMDTAVKLAMAAEAQQTQRGAASSSRRGAAAAAVEAALRASPYASWRGTSAPLLRFLCLRVLWPKSAPSSHGAELATADANLDYLRRGRALHQLNYYSRLNLTPKRHVWVALYQILWNLVVSTQNAVGCIVFGAMRGVRDRGGVVGACSGAARGVARAAQFIGYGWLVSPLLHLSRGLCNTVYGPLNSVTGRYMFDALSGRWMRCTVADSRFFRHELQREKRMLRTIGRAEFRRKRMRGEHKWATRLASMGFSVDMMKEKLTGKGAGGEARSSSLRSPYEVLQVRRTASTQEIKKQYKKLAMVFHPDVAQSRRDGGGPLTPAEKAETQHKFEEIANAYQILSNPEKRKAYDLGGAQGVHLHETKYGKFMSRTPAEMVQSVFGGEGFRRVLVGELLRSHWALRNEAQVSVSLHELEELQCIRVRQLAVELAAIADVHALRATTPYHGATAASAGAAHSSSSSSNSNSNRRPAAAAASTSSLPDYLKSGRVRGSGGRSANDQRAAAGGASTIHGGLGREMRESIMEELGGAATPSSTAAHSSAAPASPFVLRPGSNEFNCFSRDFEERCDRFVRHLAEACFGKQLLHEVGEAYVVGAQRCLGVRPFYAPKVLLTRKIFTGMDRITEAFADKTRSTPQEVVRKVMAEYFNMEYDSVVADLHSVLRYTVQMVLQDVVESEEVRRKRCYAVWYLGEKMMAVGERWTTRIANDDDLVAYIQQASTSSATTSKPPAF